MPLKFVMFAVIIWLGGTILGGLMSGSSMFGTESANLANLVALPNQIWSYGAWKTWLDNFLQVVTLNFDMFKGNFQIVRILLLTPIIIVMMYGILITMTSFFGSLFRPGA